MFDSIELHVVTGLSVLPFFILFFFYKFNTCNSYINITICIVFSTPIIWIIVILISLTCLDTSYSDLAGFSLIPCGDVYFYLNFAFGEDLIFKCSGMTTGEELSLNFFENQFMFYPGIGDFSIQFLFDRYNVDLDLFRKVVLSHIFGVGFYDWRYLLFLILVSVRLCGLYMCLTAYLTGMCVGISQELWTLLF